jgi:hypothetical protein
LISAAIASTGGGGNWYELGYEFVTALCVQLAMLGVVIVRSEELFSPI